MHPKANVGFQRTAAAYSRARPSYPGQAIAWLAERVALGPGAAVLDVAAGTGKLTEALLSTGARVTAVEPVPAMRAELSRRLPTIEVLAGTAEVLPLTGPVDAVAVGQAFHWFDGPAALAEFHRVLRRGGHLALLWNARDRARWPWSEVEPLVEAHRGATPQHEDGRWRAALDASELFRSVGQRRVAHCQKLSRAGLVDRVASTSFIAALDVAERATVLEQVRSVAAGRPEPLVLPYETEVYLLARTG